VTWALQIIIGFYISDGAILVGADTRQSNKIPVSCVDYYYILFDKGAARGVKSRI
jgi:hypothetical protein